MRNIGEEITNRILEDMEKGVMPWQEPWKVGKELPLPLNAATKHSYRGINIVVLWNEAARRGYSSLVFLTFNQAKELGGTVRKGEHGTQVIFYKPIPKDRSLRREITGEGEIEELPEEEVIRVLRYYTVFNLDQTQGLDCLKPELEPVKSFQPHEEAERILAQSGVRIIHSPFGKALYNPNQDHIVLPRKEDFDSPQTYYENAFHELIHASGSPGRLNRERGKRFGDKAYAFEELVAELGAAFLCAGVGIPYTTRHAEYLADWVRLLRDDKRAIFSAAAKAQAAVDFILKIQLEKPGDALAAPGGVAQ